MWIGGIKWMFLIVGTMIGAGYASGRELWQFFGHESGLAILLFTIMFGVCCHVILSISYNEKAFHYQPVLTLIVGKKLSRFYDLLIIFYLFSTTIVMMAGSGATVEAYQLSYWVGIALVCIPLILAFIWDIKGLLSMNSVFLPLLIGGLLYILFSFIRQQQLPLFPHLQDQSNWEAAFPFTALNILPLVAVLGAVGGHIRKRGEIWIASVGSALILGIITYIYNHSLILISDEIVLYEIPLFAILKDYSYQMFLFISMILWIALFTTALSGTFGLITRIQAYIKIPLWKLAILTTLLMVPFTGFGFSTLIQYLYPLYGILNLYILSALLLYPIRKFSKENDFD
jgi:uncharacterized membrane protein YkvI